VNTTKSLAAAGLLALSVLMGTFCPDRAATRSVTPVDMAHSLVVPRFDRAESTGLFIGVRTYPHDAMLEVPYAVDDAVDLAHRFVFDQRVGLVPPRWAVLALSGRPQKDESKQRLRELKEAGARVVDATSGDILHLLREQARLAGDQGLLVLSIATHGFQQDGDAYILGSTSAFGSPETSLRIAGILDIAKQASRSLIFIDACRDRIGQGSRGASPDPAAAAPHIRGIARVRGQVIFYAAAPGEYAFDDHVHRNGVFTKAVLDGLNCEAASPGGKVRVATLHSFVDAEVRRWIEDNKKRTVNPATQVSMEGETQSMPLCRCEGSPDRTIQVEVDRSVVIVKDKENRPLWRKTFAEPVVRAAAADLDADAFDEVVVGLGSGIVVFNRDGTERWARGGESMTLTTFATGDLYERKTNQIVALWNDSHASRLTVFDSDGDERSRRDEAGILRHVAIGRPTNRHAPKIAVAGDDRLLLLHAKKLHTLWREAVRPAGDTIRELSVVDGNDDKRRDIAVDTERGRTFVTFEGKVLR
jgi:hypothetical protein